MKRFDEFIDSPEIREYNKNYEFTPAEWAVLIGMSRCRMAEEKLEAWEYLLNNYSREDFGCEMVQHRSECFYRMLQIEVESWHEALDSTGETEGYNFMYQENMYRPSGCNVYSTYENALKRFKQSIYEDLDCDGEGFESEIYRFKTDSSLNEGIDGYYQRYDVSRYGWINHIFNREAFVKNEIVYFAEDLFINIPIPFKIGDIVCEHRTDGSVWKGVIIQIPTDEYIEKMRHKGTRSDMVLKVVCTNNKSDSTGRTYYFDEEVFDILSTQFADTDEKCDGMLLCLSKALKGEADWINFLYHSAIHIPKCTKDPALWLGIE